MRVDQRREQSPFGDISSMLRMYKTLAFAMLFGVFLRQIQQSRKMKIKSNSINHYQFSSCLFPYLLARTPNRHPKAAQKTSPDIPASCRGTRGGNRNTPNLIADCAYKKGARGRFDSQTKPTGCHSSRQNTQTTRTRSVRLVGHKWLERRMDCAWPVSFENCLSATHRSLPCAA
jgi:hypothetical protein